MFFLCFLHRSTFENQPRFRARWRSSPVVLFAFPFFFLNFTGGNGCFHYRHYYKGRGLSLFGVIYYYFFYLVLVATEKKKLNLKPPPLLLVTRWRPRRRPRRQPHLSGPTARARWVWRSLSSCGAPCPSRPSPTSPHRPTAASTAFRDWCKTTSNENQPREPGCVKDEATMPRGDHLFHLSVPFVALSLTSSDRGLCVPLLLSLGFVFEAPGAVFDNWSISNRNGVWIRFLSRHSVPVDFLTLNSYLLRLSTRVFCLLHFQKSETFYFKAGRSRRCCVLDGAVSFCPRKK